MLDFTSTLLMPGAQFSKTIAVVLSAQSHVRPRRRDHFGWQRYLGTTMKNKCFARVGGSSACLRCTYQQIITTVAVDVPDTYNVNATIVVVSSALESNHGVGGNIHRRRSVKIREPATIDDRFTPIRSADIKDVSATSKIIDRISIKITYAGATSA